MQNDINHKYGVRIGDLEIERTNAGGEVTRLEDEKADEEVTRLEGEKADEEVTQLEDEKADEEVTRLEDEKADEEVTRLEDEKADEEVTRLEKEKSDVPPHTGGGSAVEIPQIEPVVKDDPPPKKEKIIWIILAVILTIVALGLAGITFLLVKNGSVKLSKRDVEKKEVAEIEDVEENSESKTLLDEAKELIDKNKTNVFNENLRLDAQEKLLQAIDILVKLGKEDEYKAEVKKEIERAASFYEKSVLQQIDLLLEVGIYRDVYEEICLNLDNALDIEKEINDEGYSLRFAEVRNLKDNVEEKYKALYIEEFNGFIDEYNWNVRHNEEFMRGAYELFPTEDMDDPIRLRYAYAKAWLVHQEIVEGLNDGSMTYLDAVYKTMEAMEETDYCEFLLQEAEVYAANSGVANTDYYKNPKKPVILPDSSSKMYSATEISAMGLTPAELRYARLEIYARHGMEGWDEAADTELGSARQISFYKFMSYNDFGIYSTDSINGLTKTERHNIRTIAQLQKAAMDAGYFMIR